MFVLDPQSRRPLRVSASSLRVLGHPPDALIGDDGLRSALLYPAGLEEREDELARGRTVVHRWQLPASDGPPRWVEVTARGALDSNGRLMRVHGALTDVTDNQRVQEELATRNKELMTLFRISEVTLTAHAPDQTYEEILEELSKATGFPIAAVERYDPVRERLVVTAARGIPTGDAPLELTLDETLSGIAIRSEQPVIATNARMRPELANETLQNLGLETFLAFPLMVGSEVVGTLMLAHTEPIEPDRKLVRLVGSIATGVTQILERVAAAEALRDSERQSHSLVEQLKQANQQLESFAYSVSHDLRAPLRTMQGFAHALIQTYGEQLPTEAHDFAQRIIASGKQAEILIRDLLEYSRLTFEERELQLVDLSKTVAAAQEQVRVDVEEVGADVVVVETLPTVRGHPPTLVQVVANLISNAIKFVPTGRRPEVRIGAEQNDGFVRLWVEDNGVGVPPGQEERIFRVFERLSQSAARPGTGIGLAIVRRGMERMGGRAGVVSRTDAEGSRFWVDVPAKDESRRSRWGRRRGDG